MDKIKLRERIWIWGHPENTLYSAVKRVSAVTPVQGLSYIGATNVFFNDYIKHFDMVLEGEHAKDVPKVGWALDFAATKPENTESIIRQKKLYDNTCIAIFDDFFAPSNPSNNYTLYTPELVLQIKEQLHGAGLELWVVLYTENFRQLDKEVIDTFLPLFDGVSLWFWQEEEIDDYDNHIAKFLALTEGQKRMIGCYVYDFGGNKESTSSVVLTQLNKGRELLHSGAIEGLIVHSNIAFGLNPPSPAVEDCKAWLAVHGDEELHL